MYYPQMASQHREQLMFQEAKPKAERDIEQQMLEKKGDSSFKRSFEDMYPLNFYFDIDFQKGN